MAFAGKSSAPASPRSAKKGVTQPYIAVPVEKLEKQKLKLKRLKAETSELETQLEAAQKDAEALPAAQEACARAEKQAQQLQEKLAESLRVAEEKAAQLKRVELERDGLKQRLKEAREQIRAGEEAQAELQEANEAWEKRLEASEKELVRARLREKELERTEEDNAARAKQVRLQCFYLLARYARGAAARAEAEERAEETERLATKKQAELQLDYERRLALAKEESNRVCSSLEDELSSRRQRHEEDAAHSAAALESARAAAESAQTALSAARARAQEEGAGRAAAERQVTELQQLVRQMEGGRERTEAAVWELQEKTSSLGAAERERARLETEVVPALRGEIAELQKMLAAAHHHKAEAAESAARANQRLRVALSQQEINYNSAKRRIADLEDRIIALGSIPPATAYEELKPQTSDTFRTDPIDAGLRFSSDYSAFKSGLSGGNSSWASPPREPPFPKSFSDGAGHSSSFNFQSALASLDSSIGKLFQQPGTRATATWQDATPSGKHGSSPDLNRPARAYTVPDRSATSPQTARTYFSPPRGSVVGAASPPVKRNLDASLERAAAGFERGFSAPSSSVWERVERRCEEVRKAMERSAAIGAK